MYNLRRGTVLDFTSGFTIAYHPQLGMQGSYVYHTMTRLGTNNTGHTVGQSGG